MYKCELKLVRKFALETEKVDAYLHSFCPTDRANKLEPILAIDYNFG